MDEIKQKALERMNDILDAIKVEADTIIESSNTHDDDLTVSITISNLTDAFEKIYRNVR